MFPANSLQLFKIIASIATFNILPTQVVIDEIEELLGIKNDNFILRDSFVDLEYDSSAPIHNLQIIFLSMVILAAIPLLLIALRGIFFWSSKVQRGVNYVSRKCAYNLYLRFGLQVYLELSLTSLLRLNRFTFGSSSDHFHSIFASVVFVFVVAYLAFALIFLQLRFQSLEMK